MEELPTKDAYNNDVPVDPTVVNDTPNVEMLRLLEQMKHWSRAQRREFYRKMGGFKKNGRRW